MTLIVPAIVTAWVARKSAMCGPETVSVTLAATVSVVQFQTGCVVVLIAIVVLKTQAPSEPLLTG
jgi:hypothetical protein